jgi:NAD(P)-dependent dehydrogenase (short-subunit alcohol dehydrogenase family)
LAAARELYGETGAVELTDIRFRKALYIEQDRPVSVRLVFNHEDGNFQVCSRDYGRPEAQWRINAEGCILLRHSNGRAAETPATIAARCQRSVDQDLCYRHFKNLGLEYGPLFRGIGQLQQGSNEVLAQVALPETVAGQLDDYRIHPVLLDICLQTMAATLPIEAESSAPPRVYMPVSLQRLKVHGGFDKAKWIHARLLKLSDDELVCDINLLDHDGRVLLCIEGCKARSFGNGNAQMETRPQHLYRMDWRGRPLEVSQQTLPAGGVWLVFGDNDVFERALLSGLKGQARKFVSVHRGDTFAVTERGYTVSPGSADDFTRLFEHVQSRYPDPIRGVVYLWPAACEKGTNEDFGNAEALLERICTGFLHLVQSLGRLRQKTPPALWAVTSNAQPVNDDAERSNVLQASLWGLARVAGQIEYRDLWKAIIDIDRPSHPQTAGKLAIEILNGDGEDQVAYRLGIRYVPRLKSCNEWRLPVAPAFRPDVSYLITGGLGALGLVTAEWMIGRGARHLILAGRSELPPRREWAALTADHPARQRVSALRRLESLGASVTVAALDIADFEQLRDFVDAYEGESRPTIRGVIHAAGVASPKLIDEMSAEQLRVTLRPKVNGAVCLHRVFAERELDFFVLFSSIASVVVSDGQAAYAAANACLDAFAHWRHAAGHGGLSINWGPWGEIGMAADLNLVDFFRSRGFHAMTTAQGLEAFGMLLGERTAQAVVVAADWRTVASTGFQKPPAYLEELLAEQDEAETGAAEAADGEQDDFLLDYMSLADLPQRRSLLERHLASLACRVLRIDISRLGCGEPLNTKGLDSMMAMELKNRIERSLGASVAIVELLRGASIATIADKLIDHLEERLSQASEELNNLMGKIESGASARQQEQTGIEEKA